MLGTHLSKIKSVCCAFNIGINLGAAAGAGIAAHLHIHIVPRWQADNNFMPVLADTRVISDSLENSYKLLYSALRELERDEFP